MKNAIAVCFAVALFAVVSTASAATSSGTLTGTGTAAASSDFGNIIKFGSAPTGFTLARGASNWTLSSTAGIQVVAGSAAAAAIDNTITLRRHPTRTNQPQ